MASGFTGKKLPHLPDHLVDVWFAFVDLQATKARGMSVGPITWAEIGAYNRETLSFLSVWEKRLIRKVDDAYEAIRLGVKAKPTSVADIKSSLRAAIAARNAKAENSARLPE